MLSDHAIKENYVEKLSLFYYFWSMLDLYTYNLFIFCYRQEPGMQQYAPPPQPMSGRGSSSGGRRGNGSYRGRRFQPY